jgi:hypothetical protein
MKLLLAILMILGVTFVFTAHVAAQESLSGWRQGFEDNLDGWITDETSGEKGWCGGIERFESGSGPVSPSEGNGYALVEHGACNAYYAETFSEGSGPYAPFGDYSERWPAGGYVTELDIYLDPEWEAGTTFTYAVSFRLLDVEAFADSLRYLAVPVTKEDGDLLVAGNAVSEAGWYTFRNVFMDEDGDLAVEFQLVDGEQTLFTQDMTTTMLSEEEVASFSASNTGTGYAWFVSISEGLRLPIDEQTIRPAQAMGEADTTAQDDEAADTEAEEETAAGETDEESPATLPETGSDHAMLGIGPLLIAGGFLLGLSGLLLRAYEA